MENVAYEVMRRLEGDMWVYAIILPISETKVRIIEQRRFNLAKDGDSWANRFIAEAN